MKKIMTRAHQIAKTLEGDYSARLSMALKLAWKEVKKVVKAVVVKESAKAKMLTLFVQNVLGNTKEMNVWFPNGWLDENNIPKAWALDKKVAELRANYSSWGLVVTGILVA